ncbi:hypothetical protein NQZ68_020056 [Dissostichus eleginoides]|nr:hypothetical protein NQZ68_020056 [Dissostichus eleginoides]
MAKLITCSSKLVHFPLPPPSSLLPPSLLYLYRKGRAWLLDTKQKKTKGTSIQDPQKKRNTPEGLKCPGTNPKTLRSPVINSLDPQKKRTTPEDPKREYKPKIPRRQETLLKDPKGPGRTPKYRLGTETTGRRAWHVEDGEITLSWTWTGESALHRGGGQVREMSGSWESRTLQKPPDKSRLRTRNNAIQSWEPSPWKHMLRKEN